MLAPPKKRPFRSVPIASSVRAWSMELGKHGEHGTEHRISYTPFLIGLSTRIPYALQDEMLSLFPLERFS